MKGNIAIVLTLARIKMTTAESKKAYMMLIVGEIVQPAINASREKVEKARNDVKDTEEMFRTLGQLQTLPVLDASKFSFSLPLAIENLMDFVKYAISELHQNKQQHLLPLESDFLNLMKEKEVLFERIDNGHSSDLLDHIAKVKYYSVEIDKNASVIESTKCEVLCWLEEVRKLRSELMQTK